MPRAEDIITVRIPAKDRKEIERLVDEGAFHNRSDFLRHAVRAALRELSRSDASARVDLEFEDEDFQLPQDTETGLGSQRRASGQRRMSR